MDQLLYKGALAKLDLVFNERIKRFKALADKMENSIALYKSYMGSKASEKLINQKREFSENIDKIETNFIQCQAYSGDEKLRTQFSNKVDELIHKVGSDYIKVIQKLDEDALEAGISWLLSIVEKTRNTTLKYLPSYS
jgi:glutamyl-tRNA reductase